ncbi:MAG: amidase [Rhizobiales bacterium NRL2]|jgi:aspartyl-tRNA(Asn)/glutamyl-tRNA(Gln) amidotransferase subunit A|nr:MAG: amidase [Rhizobiales bacterium NRL2]
MLETGLAALAEALAAGRTTSAALTDRALAASAEGEGPTAFMQVYADRARAEAAALDGLRKAGREARPFAGIPISIKDLFDEAGHVTTAGSKALADAAPANLDAPIVDRLRRAGFVITGRTVMTEFAYSGLGLNPHYGTPAAPWDRATGRIPGGSTSGGAVSVADRMAAATIGTDTGGSCRIPAAFCGITGFKPTMARIPRAGATPLSHSLDSVGPLGNSVGCCAILDDIMAGGPGAGAMARPAGGLRLATMTNYVTADMDETVAAGWDAALKRLRDAGAAVVEAAFPEIDALPALNAAGGFAAADAWAWHRTLIADKGGLYDPRVISRIERGAMISAADYIDLMHARSAMQAASAQSMGGFDAVLMPTVPIVPPPFAAFEDDESYARLNLLCLRNPSVGNFLDRPSISLPCHEPDEAPVGLMLMGHNGLDRELFDIAAGVEKVLGRS